jgi:hypothetical protein
VYECKWELGSKLTEEIVGDDSDLASVASAVTPHNIYRFDFVNKTVTFQMLNNKGKEFAVLGMGQATKYTTDITLDANNVSWTHVIIDSPEGSMSEHNTLALKSGKLHKVMTLKPASGEPPQTMEEEHICIPYAPNTN